MPSTEATMVRDTSRGRIGVVPQVTTPLSDGTPGLDALDLPVAVPRRPSTNEEESRTVLIAELTDQLHAVTRNKLSRQALRRGKSLTTAQSPSAADGHERSLHDGTTPKSGAETPVQGGASVVATGLSSPTNAKPDLGETNSSEMTTIPRAKSSLALLTKDKPVRMLSKAATQCPLSQHVPQRRGRTLCLLPPNHCLRRGCSKVVYHPWFDNFILALIVVSGLILALDSPLLDPDSNAATILYVADIVVTLLFAVESVMKIIVMGFVANKGAYLSNGWNVLDFGIVVTSLLTIIGDVASSLKVLRTLRTLRALRPLRVISRNPGLKLVVNALFRAIPAILNVLFVCILFFLIFGIIGVTYFKGAFHVCTGATFEDLSSAQVDRIVHPVPYVVRCFADHVV